LIKALDYYKEAKELLSKEEPIYLNKAIESSKSHLHSHNFIEIAFVASGVGIHSIGDKEYEVSKGDLFIINYDIPHEFKSLEDSKYPNLHIYNCIFRPYFLDDRLTDCKDFYEMSKHFQFPTVFPEGTKYVGDITLMDKESAAIDGIYEKMFREYELKEEGYIEILRVYVIELLITIFRLYNRKDALRDKLYSYRQEMINKVTYYMKENYAKDIKLEDLANMAFLSPNYFSKLFKECTSHTISEYIQKLRIKEACKLLKTTDIKIIEISGMVGYKDIKYFNEIFKRWEGKTPGEYRKY